MTLVVEALIKKKTNLMGFAHFKKEHIKKYYSFIDTDARY